VAHPPTDSSSLRRTPLWDLHQAGQARLIGFGGWDMPVQYAGITAEHHAVRQRVGMFDISHMGKFVLWGDRLIEQLQSLVPSDLSRLQSGVAKYTVLLNAEAGIVDDLIFYHQGQTPQGQDQIFVIVNAATTAKDQAWLLSHLDPRVEFEDITAEQALIAVQGPQAMATLQPWTPVDLTALKPYRHLSTTLAGQSVFLARTGYTGEDGFEIMTDPEGAQHLWQQLLAQGVIPCGLGARDTLRLEAAMVLYGQDIDENTTPLEAGLNWLVQLSIPDFLGRPVLEQQLQTGVTKQLVGLQMQGRNIARHGYSILFQGQPVGTVTSGTFSPTFGKAIALAYVPPQLARPGQAVEVEIRGRAYPATVVQRPFYRRNPK
jgi:aminomethyltransferase